MGRMSRINKRKPSLLTRIAAYIHAALDEADRTNARRFNAESARDIAVNRRRS